MKEKTANCKNVLQQRYEGLKADSIGGAAPEGQLGPCPFPGRKKLL